MELTANSFLAGLKSVDLKHPVNLFFDLLTTVVNRSKNRFTTATALLGLRDEAGRVDVVLGRGQAEDQCMLLSFSTNQILEQLPGKLVAAVALRTIGM